MRRSTFGDFNARERQRPSPSASCGEGVRRDRPVRHGEPRALRLRIELDAVDANAGDREVAGSHTAVEGRTGDGSSATQVRAQLTHSLEAQESEVRTDVGGLRVEAGLEGTPPGGRRRLCRLAVVLRARRASAVSSVTTPSARLRRARAFGARAPPEPLPLAETARSAEALIPSNTGRASVPATVPSSLPVTRECRPEGRGGARGRRGRPGRRTAGPSVRGGSSRRPRRGRRPAPAVRSRVPFREERAGFVSREVDAFERPAEESHRFRPDRRGR